MLATGPKWAFRFIIRPCIGGLAAQSERRFLDAFFCIAAANYGETGSVLSTVRQVDGIHRTAVHWPP
jgi:hypothetical protein